MSKYLRESSATVCSLIELNELSSRIGAKHCWQAKLTLTLVPDIFYISGYLRPIAVSREIDENDVAPKP